MTNHANAKLGPKGRLVICRRVIEQGWSLTEAAEAAGVSVRTAGKWVRRYRAEGEAGLLDRSPAPRRIANVTPPQRGEAIAALRRLRLTGPEIAGLLQMATSTVSAVLRRIGLGRLSRLDPPEPVRRYERSRPGELIHVDVKKLGRISVRGAGHRVTGNRRSQFELGGETHAGRPRAGSSATSASTTPPASPTSRCSMTRGRDGSRFPASGRRLVPGHGDHGRAGALRQRRLLPIPCPCGSLQGALDAPPLHPPYRPRTNGKAERFIQTLTNRWAYGAIYGSSAERTAALPGWLDHYNFRRGHGSLGHRPPAARLAELEQPRE